MRVTVATTLAVLATTVTVQANWKKSNKRWQLLKQKRMNMKVGNLKSALTAPDSTKKQHKKASVFNGEYLELADGREYGWSSWKATGSICELGNLKLRRNCIDEVSGHIDSAKCRKGGGQSYKTVSCSLENMHKFSVNKFVHKQQKVNDQIMDALADLEDIEGDLDELMKGLNTNKKQSRRTRRSVNGWENVSNYGRVAANGMSYAQPMRDGKPVETAPDSVIKQLEVQENTGSACCENLYTCGDSTHFYKSGKFKFHGLDKHGKAIYQKPDAGYYYMSQMQGTWQLSSDIVQSQVTSYMFNEDHNTTCPNDISQVWKDWAHGEHEDFATGCGEKLDSAVFSCGKPFVDPMVGGQTPDEPLTSSFPLDRVMGGEEAVPHSFPWQVSVRAGKHFCGGALIRPDWVLTAAHCAVFFKNWGFSVMVGEHNVKSHDENQQQICIEKIYIHPKFHKPAPERGNDIAILKLAWPVTLSKYIAPICLPPADMKFDKNSYCIVSGWGKTDPMALNSTDVLMQAKLDIADDVETCAYHDENIMCAGGKGKGSCKGDSGGPLQCYVDGTWYLAGLVSFGVGDGQDIKCAAWEYPSMFTRVTKHIGWIAGGIARHGKETAHFSEWSEWSECTEPCGRGRKTRSRSCLGQGSCIGPIEDNTDCNIESCDDRCLLSDVNFVDDNAEWATGDCVGNDSGSTEINKNCRIRCKNKSLVPKNEEGLIIRNVRCRCNAEGCRWVGPKATQNPDIHCVNGGECVHPLKAYADMMDDRLWLVDNKGKTIYPNETASFETGTRLWVRCPPPPGLSGPQLPSMAVNPTRFVCKAVSYGSTIITKFFPKPPSYIDGLKVCPGIRYNQMEYGNRGN